MKTVILITVIESLAIMLAILYFYYRRSQSGKRALVLRRRSQLIDELLHRYEHESGRVLGGNKI